MSENFIDYEGPPDLTPDDGESIWNRHSWIFVMCTALVIVALAGIGWYQRLKGRSRSRDLEAESKRRWQQKQRE